MIALGQSTQYIFLIHISVKERVMQVFDETPTSGNLYVKGKVITSLPWVAKNIILQTLAILARPWLKPELQNALYISEEN